MFSLLPSGHHDVPSTHLFIHLFIYSLPFMSADMYGSNKGLPLLISFVLYSFVFSILVVAMENLTDHHFVMVR